MANFPQQLLMIGRRVLTLTFLSLMVMLLMLLLLVACSSNASVAPTIVNSL